jgi:4-amino-4-deoxy-L-arabinose transferase-like glycosyltransferase
MVALPAVALLPLVLLARPQVLRRWSFWGGVALGWLPVALWLGLSLQQHGAAVVGGLVEKLLFLSGSDTYSAGPLYYLWNIPANAAPWSLAGLAGLAWGWRRWRAEQRLVLVVVPLLLLTLLSAFRTKTPYYGLQLTPFVALWAAAALRRFAAPGATRPRWLAWGIAGLGGLLLAAGLALLWPGTPLDLEVPPLPSAVLAAAALAVGLSWGLLPLQHQASRSLAALLLGPWLAVVLLVQAGLFTDRSPLQRQALAAAAVQTALAEGPVAVIAPEPLSGDAHSQLILVALGSPQLGPRLQRLEQLPPGQWAWIQRPQLPQAQGLGTVAAGDDLAPWTLVRRNPAPAR